MRILIPGSAVKLRHLVITLFVFLSIPVGVYLVRNFALFKLEAGEEEIEFFFAPSRQSLPPDSVFRLMLDPQNNDIVFVRVVVNFDRSKVNLSGEITTSLQLTRVIQKSSMYEANKTGSAYIVLGLEPKNATPNSTFELAEFVLTSVSQSVDDSTDFSIDSSDVQIIDSTGNILPGKIIPLSLALNKESSQFTPTTVQDLDETSSTIIVASGKPRTFSGGVKADANKDSIVNEDDFDIWLSHYNQSSSRGMAEGDFDNSRFVDGVDYVIWFNNLDG